MCCFTHRLRLIYLRKKILYCMINKQTLCFVAKRLLTEERATLCFVAKRLLTEERANPLFRRQEAPHRKRMP